MQYVYGGHVETSKHSSTQHQYTTFTTPITHSTPNTSNSQNTSTTQQQHNNITATHNNTQHTQHNTPHNTIQHRNTTHTTNTHQTSLHTYSWPHPSSSFLSKNSTPSPNANICTLSNVQNLCLQNTDMHYVFVLIILKDFHTNLASMSGYSVMKFHL